MKHWPLLCLIFAGSSASAIDMDTMPEPYATPAAVEPSPAQYTLHPAVGITLPDFEAGERRCTTVPPSVELKILPEGEVVVRTASAGQETSEPLVFADRDLPVSTVLEAVVANGIDPTEGFRAASIYGARRPFEGQWCGPVSKLAQGLAGGMRVQAHDTYQSGFSGSRMYGSPEVQLTFHPSDGWRYALDTMRRVQQGHARPNVRMAVEESAEPSTLRTLAPPQDVVLESDDIQVIRDGHTLVHFETPSRLVDEAGNLLALYEEGVIYVADAEDQFDGALWHGAVEVELLLLPSWSYVAQHSPAAFLSDDNERLRYHDEYGEIHGNPSAVQRHMLQLGLPFAILPRTVMDGPPEADWDGTFHNVQDPGARWSAEGVRIRGKTERIEALSSIHGNVVHCTHDPRHPATVHLDATGLSTASGERLGGRGIALNQSQPPIPITRLDHPQVRATCVAAAIERAYDEATAAPPTRGGGTLGGTLPSGIVGGSRSRIPYMRLTVRRDRRPSPPTDPGAAKLIDRRCRINVTVGKNGRVANLEWTSCPHPFRPAAEEALSHWRWQPARLDGRRVAAQTRVVFQF